MSVPTRRGKTKPASKTDTNPGPETEQVKPPEPKRINVAVSSDVVRAIELVMRNEEVSLTEAVRRLIGYGDYVYRAVKEQGADVLIRDDDGNTREVVLLS